ncbi:MAG: hypothetical protein AAB364_01795 [Patescibacteria group bacterium]
MHFSISKIFLIFFASVLFLAPSFAHAASLSLSPNTGNFSAGQNFAVTIIVSTPDQAMNAVSGVVTFPADLLQVTSLSKGGSVVGLWVQEPSFSNSAGTINFEGVALNPGFTGNSGRVLSINFRAKRAGSAKLSFVTPAVLANDGQGSNILTSAGSASLQLGGAATEPTIAKPIIPDISETEDDQNSLNITSSTHPDQDKWYRASTAKLSWDLPSGASAVRLAVNKTARGEASVLYEPAVSEKILDDLGDGRWYFHVQAKLGNGEWSETSHYRLQIDTTKPTNFFIRESARDDDTDPKVKLLLSASDSTSGLDYYELRSGSETLPVWRGGRGEVYRTPALPPGTHTITARAFDRAGNALLSSISVTVLPLLSPTWTDYPTDLLAGQNLVAKGQTYPDTGLLVSVQEGANPAEIASIKSDNLGSFTFVSPEKLPAGNYTITARVLRDDGASSLPSTAIELNVRPPAWWRLGNKAVSALSVAIPFVALFVLLALLLEHSQRALHRLRRKVRAEVHEAEESIGQAFDLLREDLEKQLSLLEKAKTKRDLTREEARILTRVRKNLRTAEKYIKKEIEDIEKEVK